jgi:hypothetical protein
MYFTSEPPTQASRPPYHHFVLSNANSSAPPLATRMEITILNSLNPRVAHYMCENYVLSYRSVYSAIVVVRLRSREPSSQASFPPPARHPPRERLIECPHQLLVSLASGYIFYSDSYALLLLLIWFLPAKIIYVGIAHPSALIPWITVVHSRLPDWTILGFPRLYAPVTTSCDDITPIIKPVSSKLYVSWSKMPYFSFTERTSLNQSPITCESSFKARWRSYARVHRVFSSGVRLIKLSGQFLPTGSL